MNADELKEILWKEYCVNRFITEDSPYDIEAQLTRCYFDIVVEKLLEGGDLYVYR